MAKIFTVVLFLVVGVPVDLARAEALTEVITGAARAVDGDTIEVAGPSGTERVRLWAIDAPERLAPGYGRSRAALVDLIEGLPVRCEGVRRDRYGRLVARCRVFPDGVDLAVAQLHAGWARAVAAYGAGDALFIGYQRAELSARCAGRGLWVLQLAAERPDC